MRSITTKQQQQRVKHYDEEAIQQYYYDIRSIDKVVIEVLNLTRKDTVSL